MIHSAEEFIKLRSSQNPADYGRAANEEATDDIWFEVINSYPEFRVWVVHNKTVPLSVLEHLSTDSDPEVRSAVAMKRKLTPALLRRLAEDPAASVRVMVACNAKCETEILARLAKDPESFVREAARQKLQARTDAL